MTMRFYKFEISAWTSSFRYPNVVSGFQPTLDVPPLSTILGLLCAALGRYYDFTDFVIGYIFEYEAKFLNKERIYKIGEKGKKHLTLNTKMDVIEREVLADTKLYLYFQDDTIKAALQKPYYQLLLGRSTDIASAKYCGEVELRQVDNATKIKGQIVPLFGNYLPGTIQALPQHFTNTVPRQPIGTQPYSIIPFDSNDVSSSLTGYRDIIDGKEIDIYLHKVCTASL